jgi:hypothetical protein
MIRFRIVAGVGQRRVDAHVLQGSVEQRHKAIGVRPRAAAGIDSPAKVRYESDRVFFEITISPRDGCVDVAYGRFGQHGGYSPELAESLSLSIFLGAIRTHLGNYQEESVATLSSPDYAERTLADLAAGLAEFGCRLMTAEPALYERASELRFWHVGDWTQRWGTGIVMSPDEIVRQRRLVPELLRLARETE